MAKRIKDMYSDLEYVKLIISVADYVIENNASTRTTAKYFTDMGIKMSNYTVSSFLNSNLLKEYDLEKYNKVQGILKKKSSNKVMNDSDSLVRLKKGVELLMQGYTVLEIASFLGTTYDIIYNDLTVRLKKLGDDELVNLVQEELYKHKMANLKNVNKGR